MDAEQYIKQIGIAAKKASEAVSIASGQTRNLAIRTSAEEIRKSKKEIQLANEEDLLAARELGLTDAMIDRLKLTDARVEGMAVALEQIASQTDPVGQTIEGYNRPNGLRIEKRRVPIGVVGIIFESRPNVTADAAGLCVKSGNAVILRGGKEAINSNLAIAKAIKGGLAQAGLPSETVTVIDRAGHDIVTAMATAEGIIDMIIPRGGEKLIRAVTDAATIPVVKHFSGNCHVYVHCDADLKMAEEIVINSKCQRPGVCNAAETLLVDANIASEFLPDITRRLIDAGVQIRACAESRKIVSDLAIAEDDDWAMEYLDLIIALKIVPDIGLAIEHINAYGSGHTDAIVTNCLNAAEKFTAAVDSASVMVNASTRFSDGGEYGLGAEIGISTDKFHARGPMGAADLTTYKWIVLGNGQVRN